MDQETRESFSQVFNKLDEIRDNFSNHRVEVESRLKGTESSLSSLTSNIEKHCQDKNVHIGNGVKIGTKEVVYIILTLVGVIVVLTEVISRLK